MTEGGIVDNPRFEIAGKQFEDGRQRVITYSLDDLKRLEERLHNVAEGRFTTILK